MRGYFKKVTTFLLVPIFLAQSVWSMPTSEVMSALQPLKSKAPFFSNSNDLLLNADFHWNNPPRVPSRDGELVESFFGSAPLRVLVIQDAHVLPEAQRSAAQILDFWISHLGINFVGLEGAQGELPHSMLAAFPNRMARRMLAETLLNEAVISGPEYLQLARYPSLRLWGVEDTALYEANRSAFLSVLENRSETSQLLKHLAASAEEEALKVLPVQFLRLRKLSRQAREAGDWKSYIEVLQKTRLQLKLSGHYPSFDFWRNAHELSKQVSVEALPLELKQIRKHGAFGMRFAHQIEKIIEGVEPDLDARLEMALWKKNPVWLKKYPSSVASLKVAYLMRRIGHGLFEEVARLEKELAQKICPENSQKNLVQRLENLDIANSLIQLSLTAEDYKQFVARRSEVQASEMARMNGQTLSASEERQISRTLHDAEQFYKIATQRDEALARNYIKEMRKRGLRSGALVVGGFHSAGLLKFFRDEGISYEVVRPKIKTENPSRYQSLYEKRMNSQASKLELKSSLNLDQKSQGSQAYLQLQTPRRTDLGFAETLLPLLMGLSGAAGKTYDLSGILSASAASLTAGQMLGMRSLSEPLSKTQTWSSRNGETHVFWFPGSKDRNPLMIGSGPQAQTIIGAGATTVESGNEKYLIRWLTRDQAREMPAGFQVVSAKRSEVRHDDHLAWATSGTIQSDLSDDDNFRRALEIRLEAFGDVLNMADGSERPLWAPGLALTFKMSQGKVKITQNGLQKHWNAWTPKTAAAVLIALEEYLEALELSKRNVKTAAMLESFLTQTLRRWKEMNLLEDILKGQPRAESMNLLDDLIFSGASLTAENKQAAEITNAWIDRIEEENSKGKMQIKLPTDSLEWADWATGLESASIAMMDARLKELAVSSRGQLKVQPSEVQGTFLLRYAKVKLSSGEAFEANITESLNGKALKFAQALLPFNKPVTQVQTETVPVPVSVTAVKPVSESRSEPVIVADDEPAFVAPLEEPISVKEIRWFDNLPAVNDLSQYSFQQLRDFLEILERRKSENQAQFLADSKKVLPYWEALVAALEQQTQDLEKKIPETPTVPTIQTEPPSSRDLYLQQRDRKVGSGYKWLPRIIDSILLATGVFFGGPTLWASVGLIFLAYRSGWVIGLMLNEWGHLVTALSIGKWRTALSLKNLTGNLTFGQAIVAFIPFMSLPAGFIELNKKEPGSIHFIRWTGWFLGVGGLALLLVYVVPAATPMLLLYAGLGGATLSQVVAFVSDFIAPPKSETCAACGNLGGMAITTGEETATFMQSMFSDMGNVLQVRGGQAGGSVVLRNDEKGRTVPFLHRAVNTKRGVLRDKMAAGAAQSLKRGTAPNVYFDFRHVRFGTSSAPSETETHPHQWLPNREVQRWVKNSKGEWAQEDIILGNFISHNGDFDDYRLSGKMRSNGAVGEWLQRVLGYSNPALGDSPKAAGMMDFLITQGMWDASVRYAYHVTTEDSFTATMENGLAPSQEKIQAWAQKFEKAFRVWKSQSDLSRETLVKLVKAQGVEFTDEMIAVAVDAFFDNDSYHAVKTFSKNAEGTFGFLAGSSAYPNKIVMYGDSQPLSIGFDPAKKFLVWTSEPALLKVPRRDGGRIPYRLDLLQDVGEIFEVTLPQSGIPQLKVFDKLSQRELSHEEMQKSFRLIDMLKSKYVSSLPVLDYQNQDMVALDLKDMAGALDRLREDWLKADSTNRKTSNALVQILVEKYIGKMIKDHSGLMLFGAASQYAMRQAIDLAREFLSNEITEAQLMVRVHDVSDAATQIFLKMKSNPKTKRIMNSGESSIEDPVDILITGMATNLWAAEPFAARLSEMFPRLRVATTSSNKILRALKSTGLQTPIRKITVRENSRTITISRNTVVLVADGDMGQDFAPLNTTIALRKLIGDRLFVITPEYDTKLGALVQNFHKDAPFENRIFRTFVGNDSPWRPAEPTTLSQQAVDQTFTEVLLRLGQDMRGLFKDSDPFRMSVSNADFDQLRRHNREHTHAKLPDITGHNLDGTERKDSAIYQRILHPFTRWSRHISENIWAWYAIKLFILLTVTFSFPPSAWIGLLPWATALGNPLVLIGVHFFDAVLYASSTYLFKFVLRLIQGRETMQRQGTRSILIADVPKVSQIIEQYLTKLTAQATFLTDFFVERANPQDHAPYTKAQKVRRGGFVLGGFTEATLVGLGHAFRSAKLFFSQAQGIQSLPYQEFWDFLSGIPVLGSIVRALGFKLVPPEIVTMGQHDQLEPNAAKENVFLGERIEEIKASSDRLINELVRIQPLHHRRRDVEKVVQGRIDSLNESATGEFNKDVLELSQAILKDLSLTEENKEEVEIAVESYLRRHVFLTGFIEERFYQNQRIAAMQVGLHHMVSRYSYSKNKFVFKLKQLFGIGHRHWETQSHLRVATTASPVSAADVTTVAQRMAASNTPQARPAIQAPLDTLPFNVLQSEITQATLDDKQNEEARQIAEMAKLAKDMRDFSGKSRARLAQAQKEIMDFELMQMSQLADLVQDTRDVLRKAIYQAVLHRYARSQGSWIAMNGVSTDVSSRFTTQVQQLKNRAGVDEAFGEQTINSSIPAVGFNLLRKKHAGNPRALAKEIADKALAKRSESRSQPDSDQLGKGLVAAGRMQAGMVVDAESKKMRELMGVPKQKLQEASASILGSEMSDVGLVILERERPYSVKWIREYIKKMPVGMRVVMRIPDESVIDLSIYKNEFQAEKRKGIFSIEISPAPSENWMRSYVGRDETQSFLGWEFSEERVIQIQSPDSPTDLDDQMLLLSAPMAPGHILLLGQSRKLSLPNIRFIQIAAWINQLYDAVMATERSA